MSKTDVQIIEDFNTSLKDIEFHAIRVNNCYLYVSLIREKISIGIETTFNHHVLMFSPNRDIMFDKTNPSTDIKFIFDTQGGSHYFLLRSFPTLTASNPNGLVTIMEDGVAIFNGLLSWKEVNTLPKDFTTEITTVNDFIKGNTVGLLFNGDLYVGLVARNGEELEGTPHAGKFKHSMLAFAPLKNISYKDSPNALEYNFKKQEGNVFSITLQEYYYDISTSKDVPVDIRLYEKDSVKSDRTVRYKKVPGGPKS